MNKNIYILLLLNLVNIIAGMDSATKSKQITLTSEQQKHARELVQYQIIQDVAKSPTLLNNPKYALGITQMDSHIIKQMFAGNWLPQFTLIFLEKATPEKFLEVIHNNKDLFEKSEFQKKLYSLPKEKVLEFVSRSENKDLLDTIAKNAPDKLFKYLHGFGNKNFIESKSAIERKTIEKQESSIIKTAILPFIILKNISLQTLQAIATCFYGKEKVKKTTETEIRNIAHDTWSTQNFIIRKIDSQILAVDKTIKSFTVANCLFINETHFNSLSETEKRSLIAHELGHLNRGHSNTRLLYLGADLAMSGINIAITGVHIKQMLRAKTTWDRLAVLKSQSSSWIMGATLKHLLNQEMIKTSYKQEFEADKYAALHTGNNELVDYLLANTSTESLSIATTTHPSTQSRIEYLKTISQESYINGIPVVETTTVIRFPEGDLQSVAKDISKLLFMPYGISAHNHQACNVVDGAALGAFYFSGAGPVIAGTALTPAGTVVVGTIIIVGTGVAVVKGVTLAIEYGPAAIGAAKELADYLARTYNSKDKKSKNKDHKKQPKKDNKKGDKKSGGPKGPKDPKEPEAPVKEITTLTAAEALRRAQEEAKKMTAKDAIKLAAKNKAQQPNVKDFITENRIPYDNETILGDVSFTKTKLPKMFGASVYKKDNKFYHRDTLHTGKGSHLEVYDSKGKHIGEANPLTGKLIPNTIDKSKKL